MRTKQLPSNTRIRDLMDSLAAELVGLPAHVRQEAYREAQAHLRDGLLKRRSVYADVQRPGGEESPQEPAQAVA